MIKKHPVFVKLLIVFAAISLIFAGINLVWYFGTKYEYIQQTENMDKVWDDIAEEYRYKKETEDYSCVLRMPSYLSNDGFMSISSKSLELEYDENGNYVENDQMAITLHIWAKSFGGFKYGVSIYNFSNRIQIYINADGSYIPSEDGNFELDERNEALIEEYGDEIRNLLKVANNIWSLD